jgi:probable O-glycosylation ligase (exosortase A-associated)
MRELLLLGIVVVVCAVALVRPKIGLFGLMCFTLTRPDILAWTHRTIPYSMLLEAATILGSLPFLGQIQNWFINPICRMLFLLQIPIAFSVVLAIRPDLSFQPYQVYIGGVSSALLIPLLIQTEEDLRMLMLTVTFSMGILSSKFGLYGLIHGGAWLAQGYGAMLSDNNTLALFMVMSVPLVWYFRDLLVSKYLRLGVLAIAFIVIGGVVFTHSRGASVALAGTLLLIAYNAKRRMLLLAGLAIMTIPSIYLVRESYIQRMETLEDAKSDRSAWDRVESAKAALRLAQDYPWIGVGYGTYNEVVLLKKYIDLNAVQEGWMVIHNTYLQMLTDSGIFAFFLYLVLIFGTIFWLQFSARRMLRLNVRMAAYPLAIESSLVGFAIGSTFLSRVGFDAFYVLLMCAAAWWKIERDYLQEVGQETVVDEMLLEPLTV